MLNSNPSHSRNSSGDTGADFCEGAEECVSPSAWICDFGARKQLSRLCFPSVRPFMSGSKSVRMGKGENSSHNSDASAASWRARAAEKILGGVAAQRDRDTLSDEEEERHEQRRSPRRHQSVKSSDSQSISTNGDQLGEMANEPRIIAPNVSKLSPVSVVEIRLQSLSECVAILCSVDVLKMRSVFFHEVLNEQEENVGRDVASSEIWREPLVIPEISPFEAAAFLESLHEGRALFKSEWNFCWARLSVSWQVQEAVVDYAAQISTHFNRLLAFVHERSWRTSPNVLVGARVAVFRKGPTAIPTVVTGTVIEALPTTAYSKLRVVFDGPGSSAALGAGMGTGVGAYCSIKQQARPNSPVFSTPQQSPYKAPSTNVSGSGMGTGGASTAADVGEPLWIQLPPTNMSQAHVPPSSPHLTGFGHPNNTSSTTNATTTNGSYYPHPVEHSIALQSTPLNSWSDPDDVFLSESRKFVTLRDKIMFWEMCRAVMELPKLAEHCEAPICNSKDLAAYMKRQEFRVLWTPDAPEILPKDAATELIAAAYVPADK